MDKERKRIYSSNYGKRLIICPKCKSHIKYNSYASHKRSNKHCMYLKWEEIPRFIVKIENKEKDLILSFE